MFHDTRNPASFGHVALSFPVVRDLLPAIVAPVLDAANVFGEISEIHKTQMKKIKLLNITVDQFLNMKYSGKGCKVTKQILCEYCTSVLLVLFPLCVTLVSKCCTRVAKLVKMFSPFAVFCFRPFAYVF